MEKKLFGYYMLYRPPMPGAFPRGPVAADAYDDHPYKEDIRHNVWGAVWYERELTEKEIMDYELAAIPDGKTVYSVSIRNLENPEANVWVSSFDSRDKAESFQRKAEEKLRAMGAEEYFRVSIDAGAMNDEMYLDWIDNISDFM